MFRIFLRFPFLTEYHLLLLCFIREQFMDSVLGILTVLAIRCFPFNFGLIFIPKGWYGAN